MFNIHMRTIESEVLEYVRESLYHGTVIFREFRLAAGISWSNLE